MQSYIVYDTTKDYFCTLLLFAITFFLLNYKIFKVQETTSILSTEIHTKLGSLENPILILIETHMVVNINLVGSRQSEDRINDL